MAKKHLIYETTTPLAPKTHADLCIEQTGDFSFARELNAVPLMTAEFAAAGAELPIVFAGEERLMPFALLGRKPGENLMLSPEGRWLGRYVPAFLRQYPFVLAGAGEPDTFTLCVDETYSGCNRAGRGQRLFDENGGHTAFLEEVIKLAKSYQGEFLRTEMMVREFQEVGILGNIRAETEAAITEGLNGLLGVSREKLKALEPEVAAKLLRSDRLEIAYQQIASLYNFRRLADRLPKRAPAAAPESVTTH